MLHKGIKEEYEKKMFEEWVSHQPEMERMKKRWEFIKNYRLNYGSK